MKRILVALLLAATPIACGRAEAPRPTDNVVTPSPTDRDGWLAALATADQPQLAALASRYLTTVAPAMAEAWASQLQDDRLTFDGMLAQRADALHALRDFKGAAADYGKLLDSDRPFVSHGRLLYRLAFTRAEATLDDRILDNPGQLTRLVAELREIDDQVAASDEIRDHLDYMLVVLAYLEGTPDLARTIALAETVPAAADRTTQQARLTLLELGERAAIATGQPDHAARFVLRRDALISNLSRTE